MTATSATTGLPITYVPDPNAADGEPVVIGEAQVFGGSGEPTITPDADYALWINTDDDSERVWHTGAWH